MYAPTYAQMSKAVKVAHWPLIWIAIASAGVLPAGAIFAWVRESWVWAVVFATVLVQLAFNAVWLCCPVTLLEASLQKLHDQGDLYAYMLKKERVHFANRVWWRGFRPGTVAAVTGAGLALAVPVIIFLASTLHRLAV